MTVHLPLCVGPGVVQDVPCLLASDSWDRLQPPCGTELDKRLRKWMDDFFLWPLNFNSFFIFALSHAPLSLSLSFTVKHILSHFLTLLSYICTESEGS